MGMLKKSVTIIFWSLLVHSLGFAQDVPKAQISNEEISAEIFLPDADSGYYRGSRFDWSGVVPKLTYKGHDYFGKWFETYDPKIHDAIMGPVEAFDPLGYENAKVGGMFTKIGIGVLEKYESADYHFSNPYEIVDHGNWIVDKKVDEIVFIHDLKAGDYPYVYQKVIRLKKNKMIIDHKLTNTGDKTVDTKVFNHNFFVIDEDIVGPGYSVELAFNIKADTTALNGFAEVNDNKINYIKALGEDDRARLRNITGFGSTFDDYLFVIENQNTGAGVRITGDRPLSRLVFWSMNKTLCPEPYIDIKVEPSESTTWTLVYEFYSL